MSEPGTRPAVPIWLTVLLGVAAAAVSLWGVHAAAPVLGPVFLAFVLTVVAHPLIDVLVRHRVRRGVAVGVVVLVVDGGLVAFALALVLSIRAVAPALPDHAHEWHPLRGRMRGT